MEQQEFRQAERSVMSVQAAYDSWASQYDTNHNKTRDAEGIALRETLTVIDFQRCLEIGCGTGKNTEWLLTKADEITAVDLSEEMLSKARSKVDSDNVQFVQADMLENWSFASDKYDLVTFSLVLEHIEHLEPVFEKAASILQRDSYVYIGELHPFKQYTGSKARFDTEEGRTIVSCFTHHISDFTEAAKKSDLQLIELKEYFGESDKIPRVLVLLFRKKANSQTPYREV